MHVSMNFIIESPPCVVVLNAEWFRSYYQNDLINYITRGWYDSRKPSGDHSYTRWLTISRLMSFYCFVEDFYWKFWRECWEFCHLHGSGEASPTTWLWYAHFKSLSLFISLENDCFYGLMHAWTQKYLHSITKLSG